MPRPSSFCRTSPGIFGLKHINLVRIINLCIFRLFARAEYLVRAAHTAMENLYWDLNGLRNMAPNGDIKLHQCHIRMNRTPTDASSSRNFN